MATKLIGFIWNFCFNDFNWNFALLPWDPSFKVVCITP